MGPSVRLRGLVKSFGEVRAVDGVDLELSPGEIHALCGENGAGKTTLMCLLAGIHRPDAGTVEIQGAPVRLRSPRDAMVAGVGMVHQHFMLVPALSAAQNILLGAARVPALLRPRRDAAQVRQRAEELGLAISHLDAPVGSLSLGEQQRVEILRVLARGAKVMILDEPTAVLAPAEAEALFCSLERLAAGGCAVVIISHKLQELRRVAGRLTVMRRGRVVARHHALAGLSPEQLAAEMVGRAVSLELQRTPLQAGRPLLELSGLQVPSLRRDSEVKGVDLVVRAGEVLGLAGVSGNGQQELMEAVAGLLPCRGGMRLCGTDLAGLSPEQRTNLGLRYIPEDRVHTGTAPGLSVRENLLLRDYRDPPCRRGLWLDLRALDPRCSQQVQDLQVAATGLSQRAGLLSGGNIQKLILAREISPGARVILAMQPTRGLDAWATARVRNLLLGARAGGAGVLLCSEDLEEVLALSDRVAVMAAGRVVGTFDHQEADLAAVGRLMASGARA